MKVQRWYRIKIPIDLNVLLLSNINVYLQEQENYTKDK